MKEDEGGQKTKTITPPLPPSNQVIAKCYIQIISHSILKIGGEPLCWNHMQRISDFSAAVPKPF